MTERRHGLSIRPVQNELAVTHVDTVDPARGPLRIDIGQGSDGLQRLLTPHPRRDACRLLPNAHDGTKVRFPMTAVHQKVGSVLHAHAALGNLAPHVPIVVTLPPLLHLTAGTGVARLPLVVLPGPTWLGGLLGVPHCRPRRRSSSHHRRSRRPSRGRQSSPLSRSRGPHHRMTSSSSRSPSPKRHRTASPSPLRHGSRSSSPEHGSHPYDSDIRLLRLRADDDDQHPASTHPRDSPHPGQSTSVDASQLSAEKVQKLFADLITPPALSHYADPIPDSASNNQLVPYVQTSASTASTIDNSEPLETHGLFQNYQSFHRLSGDTEKEACTAAYHDLTNLMLSQTEESSLINVSSSRPKTDEPFPCGLTTSNEMKEKHDKLHLHGLLKMSIIRW